MTTTFTLMMLNSILARAENQFLHNTSVEENESFRFIQFNSTFVDFTSALTGVYDYIVKEYLEDVYRDSIELYVISSVKVGNRFKFMGYMNFTHFS